MRTDLLVHEIEPLELIFPPGIFVELRIDKIDPSFPALDLSSLKSTLQKHFSYPFPPLGGKLGV